MAGEGNSALVADHPPDLQRLDLIGRGLVVIPFVRRDIAKIGERGWQGGGVVKLAAIGKALFEKRPRRVKLALDQVDQSQVVELIPHPALVAHRAIEFQALVITGMGLGILAEFERQIAKIVESLCPFNRRDIRRTVECPAEPAGPFAELPAYQPVSPQHRCQTDAVQGGRSIEIETGLEREPQVTHLMIETTHHLRLAGTKEVFFLDRDQIGIELQHAAAQDVGFAGAVELRKPELPNGLEHPEPVLVLVARHPDHQALVDQRQHALQVINFAVMPVGITSRETKDLRRRAERKRPAEDRETPEDDLLLRRQQVVAPLDGAAHRSLPRWHIARSTGEHREPVVQPREQRFAGEDPDLRRGQLYGKGQPIQPGADRGDGPGVALCERKFRCRRLGPLNKQRHRIVGGELLQTYRRIEARRFQWRNGKLLFALNVERHPARHQDLHVRALGEDLGDRHRFRDDLLEIVQHEQHRPVTDRLQEACHQRPMIADRNPDRLRDGGPNERRLGDRGKPDIDDLHALRRLDLSCDAQRKARLANAAGAGQGKEAQLDFGQERENGFHLLLAANHRREGPRHRFDML